MTLEDLTDIGLSEFITNTMDELLDNCDEDDPTRNMLVNAMLAAELLRTRLTTGVDGK